MKDQKSGAWGLCPYTEENCDEFREHGMCFFEGTFVNLEYDKCPHRKHHTTNADRIRSLSDGELADFLDSIVQDWHQGTAQIGDRIIDSWLDWLKGEADENQT